MNAPIETFLPAARSAERRTGAPGDTDRTPRGERDARALERRLLRLTGKAIADFAMIEDGDRVMVCLSGGKDSYGLLELLLRLRAHAPVRFDLIAVNLDQKQPDFPAHVLPDYLRARGVPFHIEEQDTYSLVKRLVPEGKTMCSLCSRLRRGVLYRVAGELGATRIALGHHREDILGTFFLNMFFGGQMKAMPPKLQSDDGRHIVIRPLAYVREEDLARYAQHMRFPIIPCNLCGSQDNLQRQQVKRQLLEWERQYPGRVRNIFNSLTRIVPSHLLDPRWHDFRSLRADGRASQLGDKAFDPEPCGARMQIVIDANDVENEGWSAVAKTEAIRRDA
jgi:tRNA 2-thiocytidine biosynthesis protein TtcA